jgi:hypothetical protein
LSIINLAKHVMPNKVTVTNADGSTTDFFPQSCTDAAVAAVQATANSTVAFVPTEAQVQAAVDAGVIAAYTPVAAA